MELPRFTIKDSDHKAVHEAYVRPLEKREAELTEALRAALASFKCTQRLTDYAQDHWSNRATKLLANDQSSPTAADGNGGAHKR